MNPLVRFPTYVRIYVPFYGMFHPYYSKHIYTIYIDIDECGPTPCQNGGTCTDAINSYSCACVAGYNGDNCETSSYK